MPELVRQTLRRRSLLLGSTLTALAASGCALASRFEAPAPATDSQPPTPPTWFMVDGSLETRDVVPPHAGKGGGSMFGTLTLATGAFTWRVTYARLSGPATLAGFYGPAARGSNGPLAIRLPPHTQAVQLNPGSDGYELTGTSMLTPAQMADLMAGLWYVGISTRAWPEGEVRAQMTRSTAGVHGG
ncbi:CHRD domain-containing protein [Variovorax sp. E3]|uniref:CHRD domain-containing protein n=1 Tax=Variovorax sp. E3 TaxID=1914993 RepID=UPI0018DBFEFF|nr:CHRD domain-containing protein [Variovorax sp. E3]